jgi:hypothetical protein
MVMVHISSLARNDVLSEVCDTLRAADDDVVFHNGSAGLDWIQ